MREPRAQLFARLMSACEVGFESEFHHRNWWKKHAAEIGALPPSMSNRVARAWENATHTAFSNAENAK